MLQQMSSPSGAYAGELAFVARSFDGRPAGDASSEASSDAAEDQELPQCKIKRNYTCTKCTFYTQNPRAYLVHTRDVHFEKIKIYDCPYCVYASRHQQKLTRHINLVHVNQGATSSGTSGKQDMDESTNVVVDSQINTVEPIESMVEEIEEYEDNQDDIEEEDLYNDPVTFSKDDSGAEFSKNKSKYFSCNKCSYVTHIKARFTKHVKYHSMPMIKCTICNFRTPYKWNLDRHMKNHGGTGSFQCFMCNFTADIKQSLTMHEMNHHNHTPSGQAGASRRRNRVGASDLALEEEVESLVVREEEGSNDSRSSHSDTQFADIEMISCNSDSNDGIPGDSTAAKKMDQLSPTPSATSDDSRSQKHKKAPRPIPQLIPLNSSTPNQNKSTGEPPVKKFKETLSSEISDYSSLIKPETIPLDISLVPVNSTNSKEVTARKKNNSFFDKLKERLLTETGEEGSLSCKNCGFQSKCLSEHSVHEKNCTPTNKSNSLLPSSSSTRCQNCRHRCKSSADLYNHMKTCKKVKEIEEYGNNAKQNNTEPLLPTTSETDQHPMVNRVFVWNTISQEKFGTPLDISINDDSTLPESNKSFDQETIEEHEGMNLSPSQGRGKKVFKCPHCRFGASTASRFHVHIVGHLNKKPFECSLCKYKSNWQWDITKHIKLKSVRDPEHNNAKVLMTDETGRRNYSKYNKFLAMPVLNENGLPLLNENGDYEYQYIDQNAALDTGLEVDDAEDNLNVTNDLQPLNLNTHVNNIKNESKTEGFKKLKKTLWKCKKCNYKDPSKEALLEHVREHSNSNQENTKSKKPESAVDPVDLAYRCGHCHQLSNWKHVIQRHCRLKHDGVIKVITTTKPKPDELLAFGNAKEISSSSENEDSCGKCPFKSSDKDLLAAHVEQHQPSSQSIFKCYFCPFFVVNESELIEHLLVHNITEPEEYIAKAMGRKRPLPDSRQQNKSPFYLNLPLNKRHKCMECPYETNSKSQFIYHERFHRHTLNTPYKCPECNYSVSKRHLLHQHLRVHGIMPKKSETDLELESMFNKSDSMDATSFDDLGDIPYVWVSAKNEFHKMYKCRYCSYVNSQKCRIPYHENIHCIVFENSDIIIYKCMECKFTCDNAGRLAEHAKTHGEIYGRIYCPVNPGIPDEQQIANLRKIIESEKKEEDMRGEELSKSNNLSKILYFCQKCPARYFTDGELRAHDKCHNLKHFHKCKICDYSVTQENDLLGHMNVHYEEYQAKTKMLKLVHNSHHAHKEPNIEVISVADNQVVHWIVSKPSKNYESHEISNRKTSEGKSIPKQYYCKECPAKFFKSSALNYHAGLHGGEGEHKCKKCSYSVKNIGNLAKHELLHDKVKKYNNCDYDSSDDVDYKIPLSGTDLFQRKTEAQKKSLTGKDKLVKPNDHFPPVLQADPQFGYLMHGNPEFIYPTYLKNGRQKEKRYKCHKCPSAFEKREQYKTHLMLHGSKQRYKCELCDYSVKYYANYVQHMRKHQMNDEAQAERKKGANGSADSENEDTKQEESSDIKLAIKTMPKAMPKAKSDFQQFSVSDQQTLRILQRRRSMTNTDFNVTDPSPTKDRKLHICLLCPYTNQRQDALNNHYRRHDDSDIINKGSHKCSHCDLAVIQSHFLRDHLKTHFSYQKNIVPECYLATENFGFTISNMDDESQTTDLIIDLNIKNVVNSAKEKVIVKIKTGEIVAE